MNKNSLLVGLLGPFNAGKSYLCSKLTGQYLEQGFDKRTQGMKLSIGNTSSSRSILYLDTYGYGEPL